jgi:hypothetical protein
MSTTHLHQPELLQLTSATTYGSLRTTSGARIGARALAPKRQAATMPQTTVGTYIHETLNVHGNFATKVTFDAMIAVDDFPEPIGLLVGQFSNTGIRVNTSFCQYLLAGVKTDPKNVGKCDLYSLFAREIHA